MLRKTMPRGQCSHGLIETHFHFFSEFCQFQDIQNQLFPKFRIMYPDFQKLEENPILRILQGEEQDSARVAERKVATCHRESEALKESYTNTHTHKQTQPLHHI